MSGLADVSGDGAFRRRPPGDGYSPPARLGSVSVGSPASGSSAMVMYQVACAAASAIWS